jgi:type I restriction enzyme, S subunit
MELKSGLKQTEMGIFPEDWIKKRIGELHPFVTSGSRGWAAYYSDNGSSFIRMTNLIRSSIYLHLDDLRFVDIPESNSEALRTQLQNGDVLISITADIGVVGFVSDSLEKPAYINQHIALIRFDASSVCPKFIAYFLASNRPQRLFRALTDSGAKAGMNLTTVKQVNVVLPPTKIEQEAIAEALSDADALIESLEQLLAKKRQIKQGCEQELLTGKRRLPGFKEQWQPKRLGEIGEFLKGRGVSRNESLTGDLPCVRYGEIYTTHNFYVREFRSWVSQDVAAKSTPIGRGDILFAGSGETKEEIGKCVAIVDDLNAYAGGDIVILRALSGDPLFLGYYLNTPAVNRQKASRGQGDAIVHISKSALSEIECVLPEEPEQAAIAQVLRAMDEGIRALESKLTKTRQLKQGIMQELLTGRIRLIRRPAEVIPVAARNAATITQGTSHNAHFNEAVVLAALASRFGSARFPLGRFRRTKLSYLLHRYVEHDAAGFLKKAAGPYNPSTRYGGAEKIAVQNGYVRAYNSGKAEGFIAGDKIAQAQEYFETWYGPHALTWLEQFRYKTNDEMELITTIDMACEDLQRESKDVNPRAVKQILRDHPEWKAKLDKPIFSDKNIGSSIEECQKLFSGDSQTL